MNSFRFDFVYNLTQSGSTFIVRFSRATTLTSVPADIATSAHAVHSASPTITRPVFGGSIAVVTYPTRPTHSLLKSVCVTSCSPRKAFFM